MASRSARRSSPHRIEDIFIQNTVNNAYQAGAAAGETAEYDYVSGTSSVGATIGKSSAVTPGAGYGSSNASSSPALIIGVIIAIGFSLLAMSKKRGAI